MNRSKYLILGLISVACVSQNKISDKSEAPVDKTAIPEKREFPISQTVNACEDFYEHACSEVVNNFELRPDRSRHTFAFSDSRERLLQKKKSYLKKLSSSDDKNLSERASTLKTVYASCMNEPARSAEEKSIVSTTKSELANLKTRSSFLDYLADKRRNAQFSFVDVGSTANQDKPEIYDFYFIADMMTLPERSYYTNKALMSDYEKLVTKFFETVGHPNPSKRAEAVIAMEKAFADNYPLPAEMRELFVKKSQISEADILKKYPSFRLKEELSKVPDRLLIRHFTPENYQWVEKTLQSANLETLKDLYLYQSLSPLMDDAYGDYYKAKFAFNNKHLGGAAERAVREERCTETIMRKFVKEIDAELLPVVFPDFPEDKFIQLAEKVRGAIIDGVKENKWLSEQGKEGAIKKLKAARLQLVKPKTEEEWYFNPKVDYAANTPIENDRKLSAALQKRMFDEIDEERNRDRWYMGPLTVNAYYSPSDNKFVMPIGILQYPFYDPKLPEDTNLGAVGAVIGHELGHGIDDKGALFDHQGKLKQWMSDADLVNFKKAGQQFVDQFDKTGHNGKLTLGENIGDWTGLTFAFRAAFGADGKKGSVAAKKDFYLQYARLWCGVMRPKMKERMLKVDPHPLGFARVNEQVKHQPGFIEAYQCKEGDKMYLPPEKRIKIW